MTKEQIKEIVENEIFSSSIESIIENKLSSLISPLLTEIKEMRVGMTNIQTSMEKRFDIMEKDVKNIKKRLTELEDNEMKNFYSKVKRSNQKYFDSSDSIDKRVSLPKNSQGYSMHDYEEEFIERSPW